MVYINGNWSLDGPTVLEKLKVKFWRSFNQKNITQDANDFER